MADPQQATAPPQSVTFDTPASISFDTDSSGSQSKPSSFMDSVDTFLAHATKTLRALVPGTEAAANAGNQMVQHPVATARSMAGAGSEQGDLAYRAADAFKNGRYVEGLRHAINYLIPGFGPALDAAEAEYDKGDHAAALGDLADISGQVAIASKGVEPTLQKARTSAATPGQATAVAKTPVAPPSHAAQATPDAIKAFPPSNAAPYSPADIHRTAPYLAEQHAATPVGSVQDAVGVMDAGIKKIEAQVNQYIAANPHRTIGIDPMAAARGLLARGARLSDVPLGADELSDFKNLGPDMTLPEAEAARIRLNAENQQVLANNKYDVQTAMKADPKFAARAAAAKALRDGIYDTLDSAGIHGVRNLRLDEGSLIKLRDAAQRQYYRGDTVVRGTGSSGMGPTAIRAGITAGGAAAGGTIGSVVPGGTIPGAAGGAVFGNQLANRFVPADLTRDALVTRFFKTIGLTPPPNYPSIPSTMTPRGMLNAPATPLKAVPLRPSGPSATAPVVGGTSQPSVFGNRLQLPAGTANGELTRTNLVPSPDTSGGQLLEARPVIARDPKTGRFKIVYTAEPKGGGS